MKYSERLSDPDWNICETTNCKRPTHKKKGKLCPRCINRRAIDKCPNLYKLTKSIYYLKNRERIINKATEYFENNKEKIYEYRRKRYRMIKDGTWAKRKFVS